METTENLTVEDIKIIFKNDKKIPRFTVMKTLGVIPLTRKTEIRVCFIYYDRELRLDIRRWRISDNTPSGGVCFNKRQTAKLLEILDRIKVQNGTEDNKNEIDKSEAHV